MARFARDRRLVEAIVDGVDAMLHAPVAVGDFDSHDLIHWLNTNRASQLNDLYDLYHDCADPKMTAHQQIGTFLYTLGQIKTGEIRSPRQITRPGEPDRNGTCEVSVWEVSDQARAGLSAARETLFGAEGFFERIARERIPNPAPDWLSRVAGSFKDDPVFAEIVRLGREAREADRPADDEP
jgi:hypothetical protein